MITFNSHPDCESCTLSQSATHRGIPSRPHSVSGKARALLVIGEAPGYTEDRDNLCWVGTTGKLLSNFIDTLKYAEDCDVFLSNSCRCRPPQNATPNRTQQKACQPYILDDLDILHNSYQEVILLLCGSTAVTAMTGAGSLKTSFQSQGQPLSSFTKGLLSKLPSDDLRHLTLDTVRVFCTYHPAILLPGRKPALITAVSDHLSLLKRYLTDDFVPNTLTILPEVGTPPAQAIAEGFPEEGVVCVDIETYGILKGVEQTVFHPTKSKYVDGIPFPEQIITVSIGVRLPQGTHKTILYVWSDLLHRSYLRQWFRLLKGRTLLGQNIKFDVQYLRAGDSEIAQLLTPANYTLDDTLLSSFLLYEQRPEKGLKELATLFGLSDYSRLEVTGKTGSAKGPWDPNLHYYNCLDVAVTLDLYKHCWHEISKTYGADSPKLSPVCTTMRNEVLWDVIGLESSGFCVHPRQVRLAHNHYKARSDAAVKEADELGVIIRGKGSEASTRDFMKRALSKANLLDDCRVKLTDKKRELSVGIDNFNLLDGYLSVEDSPYFQINNALKEYHTCSKICNTYTGNLLTQPKKGIVYGADRLVGFCYPSWYPIPLNVGKNTGTEGGTIQGRFSCKGPAAQTFPPSVKQTVCSRFPGGKIIGYDQSQIELRTGALLSGDPIMLREYAEGIDRHTETALLVFPDADVNLESFRRLYRQAGKTLNFLVLYRGGARKFQETVMKDLGIHLELQDCEAAIRRFNTKYLVFRQWQDSLITTARQQGYIVLPTGWSRSFSTGYGADTYINEICNFPIQTIAAQLMQSAQYAISCEMMTHRMRSRIVLQIHDALYVDVCPGEEPVVDSLMEKYLTRPPLLGILDSVLGRTVPIEYEKEVA